MHEIQQARVERPHEILNERALTRERRDSERGDEISEIV
jgi:hypothetical protein